MAAVPAYTTLGAIQWSSANTAYGISKQLNSLQTGITEWESSFRHIMPADYTMLWKQKVEQTFPKRAFSASPGYKINALYV